METKLIWGNLVSNDLEKTAKFYTDLGFKSNGESEEMRSFKFGQNGFIINFFTKQRLAEAINGNLTDATTQNEIIFSISADTKEEVTQWVEKVKLTGGTIFAAPQNYEKGYTFGFSDPDGHKFNILYWPGM